MDEIESRTLVEVLLANSNFSDFFGDLERMQDFQNNINVNLEQLKLLKNDFQNRKMKKQRKKNNWKILN